MDIPVVFNAVVQDEEGNVLEGATITVTTVSSGSLTALYSDLSDTPLSNPFVSASGKLEIYCEKQIVNVTAAKDGYSTTWSNVHLNANTVTLTNSNNSTESADDGVGTSPLGWSARYSYNLTQSWTWTATQTFYDITADNIDASYITAGTANGTNDISGVLEVNGQLAANSVIGIKDITLGGDNGTLMNISGELKWDGDMIWDSGNLADPNYFYGLADEQHILSGTAINSTTAVFYLPTKLLSAFSGFTFAGTFKITKQNGTLIQDGFTTFSGGGLNSPSLSKFVIYSLTGLTANDPLEIRCDGGSASIMVNS